MVILIIHVFCMYEFTYLLKCVCNPEISTHSTFTDICSHKQNGKKFELRISVFQLRLNEATHCPVSSSCTVNRDPFHGLWCHIFCIVVNLMVMSVFKVDPGRSARVLSSVPNCKRCS